MSYGQTPTARSALALIRPDYLSTSEATDAEKHYLLKLMTISMYISSP